ncbi:hypothetical protein KUV80_13145 [Fictibacillus nanhaiensis]|uniref:hypothetical protein n=1 Tax=Fictibacillus nanhaiensis TaxID=742169 RepID=UPI001C9801AE|nr:hypothetical protein [Fictibacillus nanhaiensis]MBY6037610.1 hypothetical protein [Fictibacillus nanhaiensis]
MNPTVISSLTKPVRIKASSKPAQLSKDYQQKVENFWEVVNANHRFTRGEVFFVESIVEKQDFYDINLVVSDYAHYLYSVRSERKELESCKVIYGAGLVETKDSFLIFGEMANHTAYPQRLQCVGGGLSKEDLNDGFFDLERNVLRELTEELGIHYPEDIQNCSVKYIKTGGTYDFIAVLYHIQLNVTLQQFQERYEAFCQDLLSNGEVPEFQDIIYLKNDSQTINNYLQHETRLSVDYLFPLLKQLLNES